MKGTKRWGKPHSACALVLGRQLGTGKPLFDTYVLGIKRRHRPKGWAMPGGAINEGESPKQAAMRELREETGLIAKPDMTFHVYTGPCATPDKRSYDVAATYVIVKADGEPQEQPAPHDEGKVAWVAPPLLFDGPFGPYARVLWTVLQEMIEGNKGFMRRLTR